jgi:peptidoglycan/xylan/chitin deacetylase (PgdA/CDA1 family)
VAVSLVFHGAAIIAWIFSGFSGATLLMALVANHVLLGLIGMWPRSRWLGQNMVRLPAAAAARGEVALTFDDGPDPAVTPQVLDLLDQHGAKASFFCVGDKAQAHPGLVAEILRRGHSVENHSHRHSNAFACLGPWAARRELQAAQDAIAAAGGRRPEFFRAPMGLRNPFLDPVVCDLGLHYVSWTRRGFDAVSRDAHAVLRRLCRGLAAGDILVLHDTNRTRRAVPLVLEVLPVVLEKIRAQGLRSVSLPASLA